MQLLSQNAIVHISAGFEGPFILQAFGVRRDLYRRGAFNFCLTDGEVYIGAVYEYPEDIELDNYYLVQITAKFEDRFHPLTIKTLQVLSTAPKKLAGRPPCTLQDYFNREVRQTAGMPTKKVKLDEPESLPSRPAPTGNQTRQEITRKHIINLDIDKRALKLASESEQDPPDKLLNQPEEIKALEESKFKNSPLSDSKQKLRQKNCEMRQKNCEMRQKNCELRQLYERATGWVMLCRVNYLSVVECQNGLFAANFIISDETGAQMKCVYFVAEEETARERLVIGNYYLLSGGEVKFVAKEKELQITFDKNSEIVPQQGVYFLPQAGKYKRIDQILDEQHLTLINILGVIRKVKSRQQFKSKTKYTATLCDPLKRMEVDFMLFLNNGEKDIKAGMVVVLHNFQVSKQQNIFRLNSTYKSYYFEEKALAGSQDIVATLSNLILNTDWEAENYRNISMFAFTYRSILDLKEIARRTQDERLYSSLDVLTLDVARKKSYHACRNCKRPADKKEMGLYECVHCKKIVQTITTHALSVNFADSTGSCNIDVIGQHAQNLLGIRANDFYLLSSEEQVVHLESLKFKNVIVRLKSEKKSDKKELGHSVWGIDKPMPETTLRQIRKRLQINRLKQEEAW